MKLILPAIFLAAGAVLSTSAMAQSCNIRDFLVQDVQDITQSGQTELAFVITSTQDEWEKAKTGITSGADVFGLFSGDLNYEQSKDKAQRIASATSFSSESSYSNSYFTQTVWPGALDAYKACLNGQKDTPGLAVWLDKRQGDYLTFDAFWVGNDTHQSSASLTAILADGGTVVQKEDTWLKAQTQSIVVKRNGNNDIFLSMTVGDQSNSVVVVKDPTEVVWKDKIITSKQLTAGSTHSDPCSGTTDSDTIYALDPGSHFVPGSDVFNYTTTGPSFFSAPLTEMPTKDAPTEISVKMTQSTGACGTWTYASGQLSARERYPTSP